MGSRCRAQAADQRPLAPCHRAARSPDGIATISVRTGRTARQGAWRRLQNHAVLGEIMGTSCECYLRGSVVYIPTLVQVGPGGHLRHVEPVFVIPIEETD